MRDELFEGDDYLANFLGSERGQRLMEKADALGRMAADEYATRLYKKMQTELEEYAVGMNLNLGDFQDDAMESDEMMDITFAVSEAFMTGFTEHWIAPID